MLLTAVAHRAVSQREYPKFLRNLEKHCIAHYQKLPLDTSL